MLVSVSESLPSEGQREMQQTTKTYRTTHLVMGTRSLILKLRIHYNITIMSRIWRSKQITRN